MDNEKNKIQKEQRERHLEASGARFEKIIKKKMTTLMIGSLDAFEKTFDDIKEDYPEDWAKVRKQIMDLGNKQIRGVIKEIGLHDIDFKGYITVFRKMPGK